MLTKVLLFIVSAVFLFRLHVVVGKWLEQVFGFFKLNEIYNFEFPSPEFFTRISAILFLAVLGYFAFWFGYRQVKEYYSVLTLHPQAKKLIYIEDTLVSKNLHIISIPEIDIIVLRQNLFSSLFHIGTLELQKKSGERIMIASLKNASQALKGISSVKHK